MIRYLIRDKKTGNFLRRVKSAYGTQSSWVSNADDATLITTSSAASQLATKFCGFDSYGRVNSYRKNRACYKDYPVEVIEVQCLLIPIGCQPFVQGVKNDHLKK